VEKMQAHKPGLQLIYTRLTYIANTTEKLGFRKNEKVDDDALEDISGGSARPEQGWYI
jgi:hypothetical protein